MAWRIVVLVSMVMFGCSAGASVSAENQLFVPRPNECVGSVALTFDDGPHAALTPILLNILRERDVQVTFFVVGNRIAGDEIIIQRMVLDGHSVQNHSWSHPMLTHLSDAEIAQQLELTTQAIVATGAPKPVFVRPPYGDYDARVLRVIAEVGLTPVTWTAGMDPRDWERPAVIDLVAHVVNSLRPGGVVLLHDIHENTINAVPYLIDAIHRQGYCIDPFLGEDHWILTV